MRGTYYATVIILSALCSAGCAHYGALDEDRGKSYNAAKAGQILNPGASNNLAPVTGLPGAAADGVMKKYAEGFAPSDGKQQAPKPVTLPLPTTGTTGMDDGHGKK